MTTEDTEQAKFEGTLQYVEARWRDADRATLRHAFALLARGRPVSPELLAERADVGVATAADAMRSGPTGLDGGGELIELFGVMLAPTLHRVEIGGQAIFACCAVVAQALPALVDRPATVESVDPVSRRLVKLRLSHDSIEDLEPSTAVACCPTTAANADPANVREAFCCHLRHFAGRASAKEFAALNARRQVISIVEMHALAHELVSRIWSA